MCEIFDSRERSIFWQEDMGSLKLDLKSKLYCTIKLASRIVSCFLVDTGKICRVTAAKSFFCLFPITELVAVMLVQLPCQRRPSPKLLKYLE